MPAFKSMKNDSEFLPKQYLEINEHDQQILEKIKEENKKKTSQKPEITHLLESYNKIKRNINRPSLEQDES